MTTLLSSFKDRKRPLFNPSDGYWLAMALNALAVLIMFATIVTLSLQAQASDRLDPMNGWQTSSGTAGMMYFKMPFHASDANDVTHYGFTLTSQPPAYRTQTLRLTLDTPALINMRFRGFTFDDFRMANRSLIPSRYPGMLMMKAHSTTCSAWALRLGVSRRRNSRRSVGYCGTCRQRFSRRHRSGLSDSSPTPFAKSG